MVAEHFQKTPSRRAVMRLGLAMPLWVAAGWPCASAQPFNDAPGVLGALTGLPVSSPEARLISIYRAIGAGDRKGALALARALTVDVPNFQLGQLVYGDLLLAGQRPLADFGSVPAALPALDRRGQLDELRDEARRRLAALKEMPPPGYVPRQVIELAQNARHVVVVDASHSRVYVFEHLNGQLHLRSSQYASVGRAGVEKRSEGDLRTPLGVYYITSRLDDRQVDEMYGVGALPLNFPNEYDRRMGRTGGGIWLHGVPRSTYSRSPYATEGCVALANEDMGTLMRILEPRRTPVIIAEEIQWVRPKDLDAERAEFRELLAQWADARSRGDAAATASFYSEQFQSGGLDLAQWRNLLDREATQLRGRRLTLREVSVLAWRRQSEVSVVTFAEIRQGSLGGPVKRQYWGKETGRWKVFYEGVIG